MRHCRDTALQSAFVKRGVLLTSYGMVLHNAEALASTPAWLRGEESGNALWDFIFLDEASMHFDGIHGHLPASLLLLHPPNKAPERLCVVVHRVWMPITVLLVMCSLQLLQGHKIKNAKTKLVQALRTLPVGVRVILSGTPIQNNLGEMHALYDFACEVLRNTARICVST